MATLVGSDLDFNDVARITNLPDGVDPQEPATIAQLNAAVEGLAWKENCVAASTANVNLASPGSTLDGVTLTTSDRILVKDQTNDEENGIYIWNGASTAATRAPDASTFDELESAVVSIDEGSTNAGTTWRQTEVNGTIDTDDVLWVTFGATIGAASESSAGIIEIATQGETDTGTDDARALTPLKAKTASWMLRKYSADIGDGSNTSYTVTHNFNTRDVQITVRRNSGNYDQIIVETRVNNVNSVDIVFASAPTSNQFRVIVEG